MRKHEQQTSRIKKMSDFFGGKNFPRLYKKTILSVIVGLAMLSQGWGATPDANGFIVDWLIAGSYPSYVKDGKDTGLVDDQLNGEVAIRPYPGKKDRAVFKVDTAKLIADLEGTNEWGWRQEKSFDIEMITQNQLCSKTYLIGFKE